MRLNKIIVFILVSFSLLSCQEQEKDFVKLDLSNTPYLILNTSNKVSVESSSKVVKAIISVDDSEVEELKVVKGSATFNLTLTEESKEVVIKVSGQDSADKEIASKTYTLSAIEDPEIHIESPVSTQSVTVGDEIEVKGSFTSPISKVEVTYNAKVLETFTEADFSNSFIISQGSGNKEITFSFMDKDGQVVKSESVTINVINSNSSIPLFNRTWEDENTSIVIDAYEQNSINWTKMKADKRMIGVIHRSADGQRIDKKYYQRRDEALRNGYLWGAYHLGRPGNVIKQAQLLLDMTKDDENTLLVLDLEATNSSSMMNVDEAVQFMNYVYKESGKIPVIYANHSVTKSLNSKLASNVLFKRAPLWYARFRSSIPDFPYGIWDKYFMWQFSSEINCSKTGSCLYNVPGTTSYMDVNVYAGPESELRREWSEFSGPR